MPSDSTSDSETYSSPHDASPHDEPPTPRTTLILAQPPTLLSLLRSAAINLLLPFINGLMLGVGELVANEAAFRLGWAGTKVCPFPSSVQGKTALWTVRGEQKRANAGLWLRRPRSSPRIVRRGERGRAWRCGQIRWSDGGGVARRWICGPRWSRVQHGLVLIAMVTNVQITVSSPHTLEENIHDHTFTFLSPSFTHVCYSTTTTPAYRCTNRLRLSISNSIARLLRFSAPTFTFLPFNPRLRICLSNACAIRRITYTGR